jgi:PAS domain S-box-containing protein
VRVTHFSVRGLSNKEIGRALAIAPSTVRAHLLSVFRKLAISSRGELAHLVFTELAEERRRLIVELEDERAVLERERSLLDAVLRQSPVGVIVAEAPSGRIVLANDECIRLLDGARPADLREYVSLLRARHEDGRPYAFEEHPLVRALSNGDRVGCELVRAADDGSRSTLELQAAPIRDRSKKITAALGILVDITRRKAAELELVRAERSARDALRTSDEFTNVVAQDLHVPAQNLARDAEALAGLLGSAQPATMARQVSTTARALATYLGDLVDLGQLDTRRFVVRPTPVPPESLLESAVKLARPDSEAARVNLESFGWSDLPLVLADEGKIARVFRTLVARAIEASPEGGTVSIAAEHWSSGVRFAIRDAGARLPHAHETKIFDRTWLAMVGARRGFGLGLLVAKGIVEAHFGRLWAESGSEGTAFHFTLPVP